jgi:chemotaxis-related protein WspB
MFNLDGDRFALDVDQLVEVLPLVNLKPLARAQPGIAGLFDFHGLPIPALDLSALIVARPALRRLSTRIVVVNYPGKNDTRHPLGLIAERATTTVRLNPEVFKEVGVEDGETPYLGPVARDASGLIQWLVIPRLLPPSVRNVLFQN